VLPFNREVFMTPRRFVVIAPVLATAALAAGVAWAGVFTASTPTKVSGASPFASCIADAGQTATNFPNTEVEPWVDVNPTNPDNIVATWQQDRWSDGGSRGLVAGVSTDGGDSWREVVIPKVSVCSGNSSYLRASDPWLSFAPNGDLYHISLSANGGITAAGFPNSAILVSKSTTGGASWGDPIALKTDNGPNILNDKESLTADPTNSNYAYAVWDRLDNAGNADPVQVFLHALGSRGPTWFSRTTNGGASWEAARMIYDPGEINQTIGNQIVVLPTGELLDFFDVIFTFKNSNKIRGFNVGFIRSSDKGATWSRAKIVDKLNRVTVRDPDNGRAVRTADFNPDVAVDSRNGNLYIVWQDGRFSGGARSDIAFTMSTDGGNSWSPTVKLDRNSAGTSAFLPSVHVANGVVGVSYDDFRNNTADPGLPTDHWFLHCHSACSDPANWAENHVDGGFDTEKFPTPGGNFFPGDYLGLTAIGDRFGSLYIKSGGTSPSADAWWATVGSP
jgi:hypothetical protein